MSDIYDLKRRAKLLMAFPHIQFKNSTIGGAYWRQEFYDVVKDIMTLQKNSNKLIKNLVDVKEVFMKETYKYPMKNEM